MPDNSSDQVNSIGVEVLYRMGYRICHASNFTLASSVLKDILNGKVVLNERIERAIRALEYAPLSRSDFVLLRKSENSSGDEKTS